MKKFKKYNFKNKAIVLFSFLLVLLVSSCEEVVNLDLETGEAKIVIDAEIRWNKETSGNEQTIKISKMAPYYSTTTPKVSGANVRVENSDGDIFTFTETVPGSYVCTDFVPVLNMDYTLFVEVEGKNFTAVEKMISVTPINRIEQKYIPDVASSDLLVFEMFFNDPEDQVNYYLTELSTDLEVFPILALSIDEFTNGNEMSVQYSDEDLKPGKTIGILHRGISENFYNYMNLIMEASGGNPFATTPGNIRGNIVNTNDSKDFALGYFRLCETVTTSYIME